MGLHLSEQVSGVRAGVRCQVSGVRSGVSQVSSEACLPAVSIPLPHRACRKHRTQWHAACKHLLQVFSAAAALHWI
jgi:hypothetical protein